MKKIKIFLFVLYISGLLPVGLSAQTVKGKLVDENNQPLSYANVILLSLPDSTYVSGTVSAEDGTFSLAATAPNQMVCISYLGYNTGPVRVVFASVCLRTHRHIGRYTYGLR